MNIPLKTWMKYKDKLAAIDRRAEVEMISFVQSIGGYGDHVNECLDYAFALATKYGEAAGAAACELYEAVAAASGITLEAMPAATATYEEVAKSLNGIHKISNDPAKLSQGVSRLVKRTAADTTLQNAVRDGAFFAWVPSGDTCAYCLMLASNGWRKAGKKTLKGDHAEHIHANCDCQYAVTFDPLSGVEGYDPAEYEAMFDGIDGDWSKKVNVVRRQQYAKNKDRINAQKRTAYARRAEAERMANAYAQKEEWIGALAPDYRDKYGEILKRSTDKMKHGFSCFSDDILDKNIKIGASKIEPKEGFFDVAMHGTPKAVCFGTRDAANMSPRLLADLIKHNPDYNGENIRLFSCETGKTSGLPAWDYCFAEELSNCLGVIVEAPDDLLYIRLDGGWYVGGPNKKELVLFTPNQKGRFK